METEQSICVGQDSLLTALTRESIKHLYFSTTRVSRNFTDLPGKEIVSGGDKNSMGFYHLTSTARRVFLDRRKRCGLDFSAFWFGWLVLFAFCWFIVG